MSHALPPRVVLRSTILFLSVTLAPLPLAAQSASDTAALTPVVVTATLVPFAQSVTTTSSTVITGDELRARGILTVADALRDVPGTSPVQTGSPGGQTSVFMRGGQSDYVKVLVDGVPLNEPGGAFQFENLTTANIDRIEVTRGPASVLYGTDAMTGVVQIFTKRGSGQPTAFLAGDGGTYKSANGSAGINGAWGALGYSAGGIRESTEGILPFNNQYTNGEISGRLDWGAGTGTTAALMGRYHTSDYHFPTVGDGTPVDPNQHTRDEGSSFALDAGHTFTQVVDAHVHLTSNSDDAANIDPLNPDAGDTGSTSFSRNVLQRQGADVRLDAHLRRAAVLSVGGSLEGQTEKSRSVFVFNSPSFPPDTFASGPTAYFRRVGAGYAQITGNIGNAGSYTAGARIDDNSAFGTFGTYRVSAGYEVGVGAQVHAALGTAFKEPTFEQNFSAVPFDSGNINLRPERSLGWEVGVTESPFGQGLALSATYFAQQFRNLIDYTPTSDTVSGVLTNYRNIAGANAQGIELTMIAGPVDGTSLLLTYTGLGTRITHIGFDQSGTGQYVVGERLIRRPSHQFSGSFQRALATKGSVSTTVRFVGTRDDIDFNSGNRVVLPGYTTVDLAASWRLLSARANGPSLNVTARATNLLNRRYDAVDTYAAPGRAVLVGGRIDWSR